MPLVLAFAGVAIGVLLVSRALANDGTSFGDILRGDSTLADGSTVVPVAATGVATGGPVPASLAHATKHTTGAASGGVPNAVKAALARADALVGAPYSQGNHAGAFAQAAAEVKKLGTDCSGLVSSVLGPLGAGVLSSPQTTQTLPDASGIAVGTGNYITVFDRTTGPVDNEHTIIDLAGQFFESGGNGTYNPSGGVSQLTPEQAAQELAGGGFKTYHPVGL